MAAAREIPRGEWGDFFNSFSQQHDDELVALEVMGAEIGAQIEGRRLHLRGISPARSLEESDLAMMFASDDGNHLTHTVSRATRVWLQQAADMADEALEIQASDGTTTLLRLAGTDEGQHEWSMR